MDGPTFFCGLNPYEDEPSPPCSVCKSRPSSLWCDGPKDSPVTVVDVKHGKHPGKYPMRAPVTCDAPLCEDCTTRPDSAVVALPDARDPWPNGVHVLQTQRRFALRDQAPMTKMRDDVAKNPRRPTHVDVPPDTRDFCPDCVRRMAAPKQTALFPEVL